MRRAVDAVGGGLRVGLGFGQDVASTFKLRRPIPCALRDLRGSYQRLGAIRGHFAQDDQQRRPAGRVADGAAASTVRTIRAAIRAGHVDTGADDPTGHDGVRRVLQGLTRQAAGRGRGQADPLTAADTG